MPGAAAGNRWLWAAKGGWPCPLYRWSFVISTMIDDHDDGDDDGDDD